MDVRFVSQSYEPSLSLKDFIDQGSRDGSYTSLTICVAWAKRSGFNIIDSSLKHFKVHGGQVRLIVGISEGGATKQGLLLTHALADSAYVFHDRRGATFHPKIYLFEGSESALLFVGSNNLTAGGAYFNYEAAIIASLDKNKKSDANVLVDVHEYLNKLLSDSSMCLRIDDELIARIVENPKYRISDEDTTRRTTRASLSDSTQETESDSSRSNLPLLEEIFGTSNQPRTKRPAGASKVESRPTSKKALKAAKKIRAGKVNPSPAVEIWTKKLQSSDAQHPPKPSSKITGNLRLAKAGNAIDHKTYFRDVFFFNENWIGADPKDPSYEKCLVEMKVKVHEKIIGTFPFRIDHKADRIAGQNNVPTVLKWGPFGTFMRANDFRGNVLKLTSFANDTYLMEIMKDDQGATKSKDN
ncbi:MAG: phospholipase D family protein [Candidatus Nanopelagicaceae bacterium]|nr:phospholipase D family protein [Candidatus Nanopelagicaceae bacterium]